MRCDEMGWDVCSHRLCFVSSRFVPSCTSMAHLDELLEEFHGGIVNFVELELEHGHTEALNQWNIDEHASRRAYNIAYHPSNASSRAYDQQAIHRSRVGAEVGIPIVPYVWGNFRRDWVSGVGGILKATIRRIQEIRGAEHPLTTYAVANIAYLMFGSLVKSADAKSGTSDTLFIYVRDPDSPFAQHVTRSDEDTFAINDRNKNINHIYEE